MATLADVLRNYAPPTESALADPIKEHFRTLPQQLATNQQAMDNTMASMYKTDMATGQPNPNYRPEAMNEFTQMMPMVGALTAWHGTPHKILGKFDINKVGTGEGAQAYGHGMYFAEAKPVAQEYANELGSRIDVNGKPLYQANKTVGSTGNTELDDYLVANLGDVKATRKQLLNDIKEIRPTNPVAAKEMQTTLADLRKANVGVQNTGNLYKVDIPDEHIPNMLNWDLPINQQSAKVQEIAKQLDPNLLADTPHLIVRGQPRHWTEVVDKIEDLQNPKIMKLLKKIYGESSEVMPYGNYLASKMTGEQLYRNLSNPTQWSKEAAPYAMKAGMEDAAVSARLNELGIKGIRYKDAMSRGADEGTSNFVVFDPSTVKILEENGKPLSRKELIEQQVNKVIE